MLSLRYSICFLAISLLAAGCSKNSVPDPGPNFTVSSFELKMEAKGPTAISVLRDDPNSGPQLLLQNIDYKSIVSVEKKLLCGPLTLQGKKVDSGDASMDNFRLSESEFPGLNKMPRVSPCTLVVTATNNIGSTTTKSTQVTLNFDKNPDLQVLRQVADTGLNPWNSKSQEITLESFKIKNTLPYPLKLAFTPDRQVVALTYVDTSGARQLGQFQYASKTTITATRVEVSGMLLEKTGDLLHETRVTVPADGEITLTSYGRIPPEGLPATCPKEQSIATIMPFGCGEMKGLFVAVIADSGHSLSIPWSFDVVPDDFSKPNYFASKIQVGVPGVEPAPQWNRGAFGIN